MKTRIFIPPMKRVAGGVAVLMAIAEHLHGAKRDVALVPREDPGEALMQFPEQVPVEEWGGINLEPGDIWMIPEGWANAATPGLKAGARTVIFCQNWAYLYSSLPEGVHWNQLRVHYLAVSHPVAWFIEQTAGVVPPILRPGIDRNLFTPPEQKPVDHLAIAYMPRKNKALAERIRTIYEARRKFKGKKGEVRWLEISGRPPYMVAEMLKQSHIFLATGFPEGCPLPPLEAMSCGCVPVGFSGFGGWDYMRQIPWSNQDNEFDPWWPHRPYEEVTWDGNGFWTGDADVMAAVFALEEAEEIWHYKGDRLLEALNAGQETAEAYDLREQREAVLDMWKLADRKELFV